jgi:hypothetical protein
MLAPLGATVADVFRVVFPAVAFDMVLPLAPMLAPLGATVADVALFIVVLAPPLAFTGGPPVVVVAFCGKQADCISDVVLVTLVPLPAGPTDAPPGAVVTAVSVSAPVVACTG